MKSRARFNLMLALGGAVCGAFWSTTAPAQAPGSGFPTKPIRLITLTTPGGSLDILARTLSQQLTLQMGQPVVVEARTGAGGNIGADVVAKATPDGYTIGMATSSTHGSNQSLYGARMPFDPIRDFAPITLAAGLNNVVVLHPSIPVKNMTELAAYAKAHPGKLSFGSAGTGTGQHLSGEVFQIMTGVKMVHVPYRGAAAAVPDLLAGQIQLMFVSIPDVLQHIRAGKLNAIAVTANRRAPTLPDIRPVAEQGYPEFDINGWFGVVAPAGTSREIVDRFNREIVAALALPAIREKLTGIGLDPMTTTPDQFAAFIRSEVDRWGKVVKISGAKVD